MSCSHPMHMLHYNFNKMVTVPKDGPGYIPFVADLVTRYKKRGWQIDKKTLDGYKIVSLDSRQLEHLEKYIDQYGIPGSDVDLIEMPCGKCVGCRLDYSKDWANRCNLEAKQYVHNFFLTLTYDDNCCPKGSLGNATLLKDDFAHFIKALRHYFEHHKFTGVKYFGCGEYGDQTLRPHYHLILFNCPIPDLTVNFPGSEPGSIIQKRDKFGGYMYYSPLIASIWNKGIITIQEANWNMEAYVSKYVLKKQFGKDAGAYKSIGVEAPFLRCSYGLGKKHLIDHIDEIKKEPTIIVGRVGKSPLVSGIPRYYKKYLKEHDPVFYESMIERAKVRTHDANSCIRAHQSLNDNRAAKESRLNANTSLTRDF